MKNKVWIIAPLIIAALAIPTALMRKSPDKIPDKIPSDVLVPNIECGEDQSIEIRAGPDTQFEGARDGIKTRFTGRYIYYQEKFEKALYLYDEGGHLVERVHNPLWVRRVK